MKKVAMAAGALLIIIGLAGYFMPQVVVIDGPDGDPIEKIRSWTALIPAIVGIPILLSGLWSALQPSANMMAMHIAVACSLVGALASTFRASSALLDLIRTNVDFNQRAFALVSLTGVICWMVVLVFFGSFMKARKNAAAAPVTDQDAS